MNWDKDNPLARCQGETKRANTALADYAMMGPARSLAKLAEHYVSQPATSAPPTRRLNALKRWSTRHDWQARVSAWEDIKRAEAEEEWGRRRSELCEIEWGKARQLLERADAMLKLPLTEKIVDSDGQMVVIKPVRWSAADIARYTETASKLMRLAAGMETERTDVTSGGQPLTFRVVYENGPESNAEEATR
jgi:hypothetical protein